MGPNGSGKSTFSKILAGHSAYEVTGGTVTLEGQNLLDLAPEAVSYTHLRAHETVLDLVCRLLLDKTKIHIYNYITIDVHTISDI